MEETLRERGRNEPIGNVAVMYLLYEEDPGARSTLRARVQHVLQSSYADVYDQYELQEIREACAMYESDYGQNVIPPVRAVLVGEYNPQTRVLTDAFVRHQGTPSLDPALSDEGYLSADRWLDYNTRLQDAYRFLCGLATGRFREWYDPEMFYRDDE